jgi:lysophospholipase L1-like esterase
MRLCSNSLFTTVLEIESYPAMKFILSSLFWTRNICGIALMLGLVSVRGQATAPAATPATTPASTSASKPTLYVIGDSTANSGAPILGWGTPFIGYFDPAKITVLNKARGGRSSRSYIHEGLWAAVEKNLKPGDIVLLQFGQNDGGLPSANPKGDRPSLPGLGEETRDLTNPSTKQPETVHTFGYYMREYVADAKAKGATIIILTPTVRNNWKNGKVERELGQYGGWSMAVAQTQGVPMVDMNSIVADKYEVMGQDKIPALYSTTDTTHSSPTGADFNASAIVSGLKALQGNPLGPYLSTKGQAVVTADVKYVANNPVPVKAPADKPATTTSAPGATPTSSPVAAPAPAK